METAMQDRADVRVLPPIVLLAALCFGVAVALAVPDGMLPTEGAIAIGAGVVAISILLVLAAVRELRRAKTSLDVRQAISAIVTTGVFRVTRNPIYLSMILLYAGIAFLLNSPWMLLLAIPTGSALCLVAIKPEERYLEAKFGEPYRAYRSAVPRWLGARSLGNLR
jgi:protein-S-isoprenylcysteine O-methyltransferase Ste14